MRFFLTVNGSSVEIMMHAQTEDGSSEGDAILDILPGEDFEGLTYEQLKEMGSGEYEIPQ